MNPELSAALVEKVRQAINPQRLVETATALMEIPSPTCSAGDVADRLASLLEQDGFVVERPVADWPKPPVVVVRFDTEGPGRVLKFDGHLDTVHLGSKPLIDDGHNFVALAGIPALTHGPAATGAHTLQERVSVQELIRVAQVYALTAVAYCSMSYG